MSTKEKPKMKPRARKAKVPAKKGLFSHVGPITPSPAFRAFALEDEWNGRRRMRGLGKAHDYPKFAPNAGHETFGVYSEALGLNLREWFCCLDQKGEIVYSEKRVSPTPEEAARDLLTIAQEATSLLAELLKRQPAVCQGIAARASWWPVMADLTEKDWLREAAGTVEKLGLGKDIKGYLLAARTADENVIRCWATAIYETLFQTRWTFKEAAEGRNKNSTREGCPEWAGKTLDLPPFTKADSRKWARLGEEMLLQQRPDFLESPDLVTKKRSWMHRAQKDSRLGKASLRAIHREAFEDFAKELKNIAPERNVRRGEW